LPEEQAAAEDVGHDEQSDDENEDEEGEVDDEDEAASSTHQCRRKHFHPSQVSIQYVYRQIRRHGLGFLHTEVFPELPDPQVFKCLEIIWENTYLLANEEPEVTQLPIGVLDNPPYRVYQPLPAPVHHNRTNSSESKLLCLFTNLTKQKIRELRQGGPFLEPNHGDKEQPTITHDIDKFMECCERLLSLHSFHSYAGKFCPEAVPMTDAGGLDEHVVADTDYSVLAHCAAFQSLSSSVLKNKRPF
jgi:hypothetical protein